jgi:hypothetical protein
VAGSGKIRGISGENNNRVVFLKEVLRQEGRVPHYDRSLDILTHVYHNETLSLKAMRMGRMGSMRRIGFMGTANPGVKTGRLVLK